MNKRGQTGIIGAIFLFAMFLIMFFVWLGNFVSTTGQAAVADNSLTGIEAFFFNNLAFFVIIFIFLAMMGWMYFAGS